MPLAPKGSKANTNKSMAKDKANYNPAKSNVLKTARKTLSTAKGYNKPGGGISASADRKLGEKGLEKGMKKAEGRIQAGKMQKLGKKKK
jgi:hypothetical protein